MTLAAIQRVSGALLGAIVSNARVPLVVFTAYLALVVVTVPFAAVMANRLATLLGPAEAEEGAVSPEGRTIRLVEGGTLVPPTRPRPTYQVDLDEWHTFQQGAPLLGASLTPAILGFAAPLDHLSAIVDGGPGAAVGLVGAAAFAFVWLFLLGGILERFATSVHSPGAIRFVRMCSAHYVPFLALAGLAFTALTTAAWVFRALISPYIDTRAAFADSEGAGALWKLLPAAVFVAFVVACNWVVDYARVHHALAREATVTASLTAAWHFIRRHPFQVCLLAALNASLLAMLAAAYAAFELSTGGEALTTRALVVGQLFIAGRLVLLLVSTVSQLRLVQTAPWPENSSLATEI